VSIKAKVIFFELSSLDYTHLFSNTDKSKFSKN